MRRNHNIAPKDIQEIKSIHDIGGQSVQMFSHYLPVYYWNRDSTAFIKVNQGGTSSGKTYSIMQLIAKILSEETAVCTVAGQDFPNLSAGPIRDFKTLISDSPYLRDIALENPRAVNGPFRFRNGSVLEFKAYDSWQDAKSGKREYLFINEAQGLTFEIAEELINRTKKGVWVDYNPNARFWVHTELLPEDDVELFISNFTHNDKCPEKTVRRLLQYKHKYETTGLKRWRNRWFVYGLGLTGIVEGVIFEDVNYIKYFPSRLQKVGYGLDFGFKNNKTALVKCGIADGDQLFGKQVIYQSGLTTPALARRMTQIGITGADRIVADHANSESIAILQAAGFNIVPCRKGNGSVMAGIDTLLYMDIHLTYDSVGWINEQENYKYKSKDGIFTNQPIDKFNDCWSGARYYIEDAIGFRTAKVRKNIGKPFRRRVTSF